MWILRWALIWRRWRCVSYFYTDLNFWYWFSLFRRYSLCRWITLCLPYFIITHTVTWRLGQRSQYSYSLQLDGLGFELWWGQEVFPSPYLSILALVSSQAPVRWVLGLFPGITWWGIALTTRPHQELRLGTRWATPLLLSVPAWLVTGRMLYCAV